MSASPSFPSRSAITVSYSFITMERCRRTSSTTYHHTCLREPSWCSTTPRATGALIEVFLLEPYVPADYEQMFQTTARCEWICLVGNLKKWKEGALVRTVVLHGQEVEITATRMGEQGTGHRVVFEWRYTAPSATPAPSFAEIIDAAGELPIPPYLNRETQESDKTTYQTVYSKIKGSVAAPTAGKSEEIEGHSMHTEYYCVKRHTIEKLIRHQAQAIAVGTTSVRTLESLYYMGVKLEKHPDANEDELHVEQWEPYQQEQQPIEPLKALQNILSWLDRHDKAALHGSTQIIIAPGYEYKIVKMLVTNFHQPQSTLLLLVSAFVKGDWHTIYDYALSHHFRFLSYGDSSLLVP